MYLLFPSSTKATVVRLSNARSNWIYSAMSLTKGYFNQDESVSELAVTGLLGAVALDASLAAVPTLNPGSKATGITSISSNNSCAAIDLANWSCEFFNIWFLAKIESLPYTTTSMLPYLPKVVGLVRYQRIQRLL